MRHYWNGPSVLKMKKEYFLPNEIIITIDDSIVQIERLNLDNVTYTMQKDAGVIRPKKAILLVSEPHSKFAFEDYSPRYIFDAKKLFDGKNDNSIMCALKIVQLFGCSKIRLIGFDSYYGDVRRVGLDGTISEGDSIYASYMLPRFRNLIQQDKLDVEFVRYI